MDKTDKPRPQSPRPVNWGCHYKTVGHQPNLTLLTYFDGKIKVSQRHYLHKSRLDPIDYKSSLWLKLQTSSLFWMNHSQKESHQSQNYVWIRHCKSSSTLVWIILTKLDFCLLVVTQLSLCLSLLFAFLFPSRITNIKA